MRLLRVSSFLFDGEIPLLEDFFHDTPPYAILSHTWGNDEYLFENLKNGTGQNSEGFEKIRKSCEVAAADGVEYLWVDTCCIDKSSSAELSEAINSMFTWYRESSICYVYLRDITLADNNKGAVSSEILRASRWFTRGWTLQELLAPSRVEFYTSNWSRCGDRYSLADALHEITNIDRDILRRQPGRAGLQPLFQSSISKRMSWAAKRETTRPEDQAYGLLGIFGVCMPLLYGEGGPKAFLRLQQEIIQYSEDQTIFAWHPGMTNTTQAVSIFAKSPAAFFDGAKMVPVAHNSRYEMSDLGLSIIAQTFYSATVKGQSKLANSFLVLLNCRLVDDEFCHIAISVTRAKDSPNPAIQVLRLMEPPTEIPIYAQGIREHTRSEKLRFTASFHYDHARSTSDTTVSWDTMKQQRGKISDRDQTQLWHRGSPAIGSLEDLKHAPHTYGTVAKRDEMRPDISCSRETPNSTDILRADDSRFSETKANNLPKLNEEPTDLNRSDPESSPSPTETSHNLSTSSLSSVDISDDGDDVSDDGERGSVLELSRTPMEIVVEHLMQVFRNWLHGCLRQRAPAGESGYNHESNSNGESASEGSGAGAGGSRPIIEPPFRKRPSDGQDEHEDDDGRNRKRQNREPDIRRTSCDPSLLFACHFCKRRPHRYQDRKWKSCLGPGPGWVEVHRVKQHLIENHKLKSRCGRCCEEFDTQDSLRPGRNTIDMQNRMKERKGLCEMTAQEKWIHWYKILFPNDDPQRLPSPYHEPSDLKISPYEDYLRHDFVAAVQQKLERELPGQMREIMRQLLDFLRTTVQSVHGDFLQSQQSPINGAEQSALSQVNNADHTNCQWQDMFGEPFEQSMEQLAEEDVSALEGQFAMPDFFDSSYSFLFDGS